MATFPRAERLSSPIVRAALTVALALVVAPASAQTTDFARPNPGPQVTSEGRSSAVALSDPGLRTRQAALLERTRRAPMDHEATYDYVEVSKALQDDEAAIGALERLLTYNSSLTRARYELGTLYFQAGSFDASATYLRQALASPELDPLVRNRAEALLPEAVKQQSQSRFSVFLQTGVRTQSNANFIPGSGVLRLGGQDFLLQPRERRRSDAGVFGLAAIGHDYDFLNQRGDVLETRLLAYGSKQARVTEYDFGYVEGSIGPRLGLPELMSGASIKPYIVGQTSTLRGERSPYVSSGGGGVSLRLPVLANLSLEPGVEARAVSVAGRDAFGASSLGSGSLVVGYLSATMKVLPDIDFETKVFGSRSEANRTFQSFAKVGAAAAINVQFAAPFETIPRKWKISPFIGGAFADYDRANPALDPLVKRRDTELTTGVVFDAPLTAMLGLSALVQYDWIDSRLPNYRQRGVTVVAGPTARF